MSKIFMLPTQGSQKKVCKVVKEGLETLSNETLLSLLVRAAAHVGCLLPKNEDEFAKQGDGNEICHGPKECLRRIAEEMECRLNKQKPGGNLL